MTDEFDDFGFTAVSEDELETQYRPPDPVLPPEDDRAERLLTAITPLLENMKKNPDKPYIHWPDRVDKIVKFQEKLDGIMADKP